jgi:hypothetical protein
MPAAENSSPDKPRSILVHDFPRPDKPRFILVHGFPPLEIEAPWREFLGRVEFPAHYDTPEFFLEPHWTNKNPFAVLAFFDSKIVGVVTGVHDGRDVVSGGSSRPQICLDPGADRALTTDILADGLLCEARGANLITVYSWAFTPLPAFEQRGCRVRELEGDVVLDLRLGAEALLKGFHANRKRNIQAAVRNGIEVREETTEQDLAAYWDVYSAWTKTDRKEIHHISSFAQAEKVHSLRENHRRFLASYKGRVIAATGLRFFPGGLIEYANNCSLDEFIHLRPNDLLIWKTIQWACAQGFSRYSLGGSHPFLRKSGGTVIPIYRYRLDRTLFHRHDLQDILGAKARSLFGRMPPPLQGKIRKVLGK